MQVLEPDNDAGNRPVLLLHGFASSAQLNWHDAGWIGALQTAGRRVITVDLPGHGASAAPAAQQDYAPSRIGAELVKVLRTAGVVPLSEEDDATGVDIIGYSLGSRLAWEFGAAHPDLVHRMVLGGPSSSDPLAAFDLPAARAHLTDGTPIQDPLTADLLRMAQLVPANDVAALLDMVEAVKDEPFTPSAAVPHMPVLLVAGERDELAVTVPTLAELSGQAEILWLPARTHANAVTSRTFKHTAIEFLSRA